jgi:NAD(P)-dependent dehydrogenase (short-subunit alcohol dehydrogenase family)
MSISPDGGRRALIISATSDIGAALAEHWLSAGWLVAGTYRTQSATVDDLTRKGVPLIHCDLGDPLGVAKACVSLRETLGTWDVLVLCPGAQEPVGAFEACRFEEWEASVRVNFSGQMQVVREMLPWRSKDRGIGPCVLFFAGGGTNSATLNYSAYTISKIALVKMCELLDAEIPDTRFAIIGPGWVRTKIHDATLEAGPDAAGANYERTRAMLATGDLVPMNRVIGSCDWVVSQPREVVGGRNFSTLHDAWGTDELAEALRHSPDMYKLRRHGNTWRPSQKG